MEFKVADAYQDMKPVGNVIVPIEYSAGEKPEKVFIRAKIEVIKDVVMASRPIKRGTIIDEQDLKLEKRDICAVPQNYFERSEQILFTEAKTNIPKNSLIYDWMIKEVPLFHRGEEVTIQMGLDNLSIKSTGIALEDGYPGKPIRIKRKGSDKILDGTVLSSKVVEVKIK